MRTYKAGAKKESLVYTSSIPTPSFSNVGALLLKIWRFCCAPFWFWVVRFCSLQQKSLNNTITCIIIIREGLKKILIFADFSAIEGGGYPPFMKIVNFSQPKKAVKEKMFRMLWKQKNENTTISLTLQPWSHLIFLVQANYSLYPRNLWIFVLTTKCCDWLWDIPTFDTPGEKTCFAPSDWLIHQYLPPKVR